MGYRWCDNYARGILRCHLARGGTLFFMEEKILQSKTSYDFETVKKFNKFHMYSPYQQAKRYADQLPNSQRPRYIVVCNFQTFHIHDMEHPHDDPEVIQKAKDNKLRGWSFGFLCNKEDRKVNDDGFDVNGINIERDSISRIEIGTRFVADYELKILSEILKVSPCWLLGIE